MKAKVAPEWREGGEEIDRSIREGERFAEALRARTPLASRSRA